MNNKVMRISNLEKLVITGSPLIGEGNIVDIKTFIAILKRSGIATLGLYPNGPLVWLGKWFHIKMTMSTKKTMDYTLHSEIMRVLSTILCKFDIAVNWDAPFQQHLPSSPAPSLMI